MSDNTDGDGGRIRSGIHQDTTQGKRSALARATAAGNLSGFPCWVLLYMCGATLHRAGGLERLERTKYYLPEYSVNKKGDNPSSHGMLYNHNTLQPLRLSIYPKWEHGVSPVFTRVVHLRCGWTMQRSLYGTPYLRETCFAEKYNKESRERDREKEAKRERVKRVEKGYSFIFNTYCSTPRLHFKVF